MADKDPNRLTLFERLKGRRLRDIHLPLEPGQTRDPRLKGTSPREIHENIREGVGILKKKGLIGSRSQQGGKR